MMLLALVVEILPPLATMLYARMEGVHLAMVQAVTGVKMAVGAEVEESRPTMDQL